MARFALAALALLALTAVAFAEEGDCVKRAREIQRKGSPCETGNTNYRNPDPGNVVGLGCDDLKKQILATPNYTPPSGGCCAQLVQFTELGCACNQELLNTATKENAKTDLRTFAAMAKTAQIMCAPTKPGGIVDTCTAGCPQTGAPSA